MLEILLKGKQKNVAIVGITIMILFLLVMLENSVEVSI